MRTKANRQRELPRVKVEGAPRIYKKGEGFLILYTDRKTGRQCYEGGFATKEAAIARDADIQAEMQLHIHRPRERTRFATFAREWVKTTNGRTTSGFREETRAEYRRDIERLIAHVGTRVLLTDVTPPLLNQYVQALADECGKDGEPKFTPGTLRRIMAPVKACLADAHADGLIANNPASGVRIPAPSHGRARRSKVKAEDKVMTTEQVKVFLANVPVNKAERRRPSGWQRVLADVVMLTGVRLSEALGLRWCDLDLHGDPTLPAAEREGTLSVRQRVRYGKEGDTKSVKSERDIPIDRELCRTLAGHRLASHYSKDTDYVFPSVQGTAIHASSIYRWSSPAFRAAGVPKGNQWHALRHTYGSRLYRAGVDIASVSKLLGHSDVGFTLRTYIHIRQDELPTGERIAALVGVR